MRPAGAPKPRRAAAAHAHRAAFASLATMTKMSKEGLGESAHDPGRPTPDACPSANAALAGSRARFGAAVRASSSLDRALITACALQVIGLVLFSRGFFLTRPHVDGSLAERTDFPGQVPPASFDRLVVVVVDAARFDMALELGGRGPCGEWGDDLEKTTFESVHGVGNRSRPLTARPGALGFAGRLGLISLNGSSPLVASSIAFALLEAEAPTTTTQRVAGIATGAPPLLFDARNSFSPQAVADDSLLRRLRRGRAARCAFVGDATWADSFPEDWDVAFPEHCYDIHDTRSVDEAVARTLPSLMAATMGEVMNGERREDDERAELEGGWDGSVSDLTKNGERSSSRASSTHPTFRPPRASVVLAHSLGVDHAGHVGGACAASMAAATRRADALLEASLMRASRQALARGVAERTLFVALGDHGQTLRGEHGGAGREEVESFLLAVDVARFVREGGADVVWGGSWREAKGELARREAALWRLAEDERVEEGIDEAGAEIARESETQKGEDDKHACQSDELSKRMQQIEKAHGNRTFPLPVDSTLREGIAALNPPSSPASFPLLPLLRLRSSPVSLSAPIPHVRQASLAPSLAALFGVPAPAGALAPADATLWRLAAPEARRGGGEAAALLREAHRELALLGQTMGDSDAVARLETQLDAVHEAMRAAAKTEDLASPFPDLVRAIQRDAEEEARRAWTRFRDAPIAMGLVALLASIGLLALALWSLDAPPEPRSSLARAASKTLPIFSSPLAAIALLPGGLCVIRSLGVYSFGILLQEGIWAVAFAAAVVAGCSTLGTLWKPTSWMRPQHAAPALLPLLALAGAAFLGLRMPAAAQHWAKLTHHETWSLWVDRNIAPIGDQVGGEAVASEKIVRVLSVCWRAAARAIAIAQTALLHSKGGAIVRGFWTVAPWFTLAAAVGGEAARQRGLGSMVKSPKTTQEHAASGNPTAVSSRHVYRAPRSRVHLLSHAVFVSSFIDASALCAAAGATWLASLPGDVALRDGPAALHLERVCLALCALGVAIRAFFALAHWDSSKAVPYHPLWALSLLLSGPELSWPLALFFVAANGAGWQRAQNERRAQKKVPHRFLTTSSKNEIKAAQATGDSPSASLPLLPPCSTETHPFLALGSARSLLSLSLPAASLAFLLFDAAFFCSGHVTELGALRWRAAFVGWRAFALQRGALAVGLETLLPSVAAAADVLRGAAAANIEEELEGQALERSSTRDEASPHATSSIEKSHTAPLHSAISAPHGRHTLAFMLLLFALFRSVALFVAVSSAAIQRRHIYAWETFAPRAAFEACLALGGWAAIGLVAATGGGWATGGETQGERGSEAAKNGREQRGASHTLAEKYFKRSGEPGAFTQRTGEAKGLPASTLDMFGAWRGGIGATRGETKQ